MVTPGGETGGSILPLISRVTEPRARHHGAWGLHVLVLGLFSHNLALWCTWKGRMLMVLWGQQAGGRWVMEESRHRAWVWGFSSGPEHSPDTLGAVLPLCRVIPHPSLLESVCRAFTPALVRVKPVPSHVSGAGVCSPAPKQTEG